MTELDWADCSDPQAMLAFLREQGKLTDRKARLFCVAVCHRVWPLLTDEQRVSVQRIEAQADHRTWKAPDPQAGPASGVIGVTLAQLALKFAIDALREGRWLDVAAMTARAAAEGGMNSNARQAEKASQCDLVRDIFMPFHTAPLDPAWRKPNVVALATTIYDGRRFDLIPVLGAALSDAGCVDSTVLGHCVAETTHVRGCHVVDLLLSKE